jgi:uncharacterized protein (TIGR02453 family)
VGHSKGNQFRNAFRKNIKVMVPQNILNFLEALKLNNNREWFNDNQKWYRQTKDEFDAVAQKMIALIRDIDPQVELLKVTDCTFRIYRDTRFSTDKIPYKTNMGIYVVRGGKKSPFAGYYLHIEPGNSLLSGGIYVPEAKVLNAVREEIYHKVDAFKQIVYSKPFVDAFGKIDGDQLKTAPKGFDKTWPDVELLRYKSYNSTHMINDTELISPNFEAQARSLFELMVPFNHFFNGVIEDLVQ